MTTDFVLDVLEQALYALRNEREGDRVHHSDRGSQYVSIRYSDRRAEARIEPSVGSRGETATTTRWPKRSTASTRPNCSIVAQWRKRKAVELATLEWVSWFKSRCRVDIH